MTRNNLNDQLSWLLANISLLAPKAPSLPALPSLPPLPPAREPASTASSPTDETAFFTPTAGLSPATRPNEPPIAQLYPALPAASNRPSSAVVAGGGVASNAGPRDHQQGEAVVVGNMGRLASKPGSKRPNLALCQEQLPSPASTSAGASLSSDYPAFLAKNSAKNQTSARNAPPSPRSGGVFPTPVPTLPAGRPVDVVDLTSGSGRDSSISAAFGSERRLWTEDLASRPEPMTPSEKNSVMFGSGKMVWREDHAARAGPISADDDSLAFGSDVMVWEEEAAWRTEPQSTKRGKKRKSDQISQPPPTTTSTDNFTDIMDLLSDDESLQASVKPSPTKSPARSKLKTSPGKSPSKTAVIASTPSKQRAPISGDIPSIKPRRAGLSPVKDPPKNTVLDKLGPSKVKLCSWGSDSDSVFGSDVERTLKREPKTPKAMRSDEQIIQDSDDEPMTPYAHKEPESAIPRTNSPTKRHRGSQRDHNTAIQDTPSRTRTLITSQSVTVAHSTQRMHRRRRSESKPVDFLDEPKADETMVPVPSSQIDVDYGDEKLTVMVQLFLRRPSIIKTRRISLEEDLRQNRENFKKSLHEGSLEPRERLRRDKEKLTAQQASLDVLTKEYRSYEELTAKKNALIARIAEAYERDLNTDDDESHLQGLDILLKDRQDELKKHLVNAGLTDPNQYNDKPAHDSSTYPSEAVVRATQAPRPRMAPSLSRESSQIPGMSGTQVIMQTQVPSRLGAHRPALDPRSSEPFRFPEEGSQSFDSLSSRRMPRDRHAVSTVEGGAATSVPHLGSDTMDYEGEDLFEADDFMHGRNVTKTTRTVHQSGTAKSRRSPRKEAVMQREGYQSDYSDDIDISELAHEIEFQQSSAGGRPPKAARTVLSETSGNLGTRKDKSIAKKRSTRAAPVAPHQKKFPWYKDIKRALKDRFRMNGFRHNQLEAINATLAAKDAFILMPTGGGKSLCYQLPAVVSSGKTSGITVVVSPLLSLMQDQVEHLRILNIAATTFNGETTPAAKKEIMDALNQPYPEHYFQLLYVTPEMINKSTTFLNGLSCLYRNKKLARLVIDEAHCVSQWGHDFRPDYKQLGNFRERFPGVPLMALTATATQNVIVDVKHNLGIEECAQFTQSFNRPNLYYEVRRKEKDNTATIADLINSKYPGKTGIVYTLSRKSAETIAQKLRDQGIASHHYHASVEPTDKVQIQRDWQRGKIKVVVATIAFGMGIDKPDVRFVIHQSVPKSLEGYYQETGRAGRDGEPSECYLYFGYGDVIQLRKLIADGEGNEEQKERQRNMLNVVAAFCDNQSDCRRVEILRYFGETFSKAQCKATCDNCLSKDKFEQKDFTTVAIAALHIVKAQERVTLAQCTDYLMAKKKRTDFKDIVGEFHGIARHVPKHEIHRIMDRLLAEDALTEENVFKRSVRMAVQYYRIGRTARSFLVDGRQLQLTTRVKSDGSHIGAVKVQRRLDVPAAPATKKGQAVQFTSTLVSSPAQKASGKRKGKAVANYDEDSDEGFNLHSNGYRRDDFVIGDDEHSDDDFETMPSAVIRRRKTKTVGPPISRDARLGEESLTEVQKDILESFFKDVQKLEERIRVSDGYRAPLFSQVQLREMGLCWTVTLDQMQHIPGINKTMVARHGAKLLPLIKRYHQQYQEIMGLSPEPPALPQLGEIVDLVTTDDDEDDEDGNEDQDMGPVGYEDSEDEGEDEDDEDGDGGETSGYFQPSVTEKAFMEKFHQANQQEASSSKGRSRTPGAGTGRGGKSNWRGGKKSYPSRRSSGGKFAGVKKKGAAAPRRSTNTQATGARGGSAGASSSRGRGSRSQGVGFDGIGLMDH